MKQRYCEWCDNTFLSNISYQIYCSAECRELATREKIDQRYLTIKRKARKNKERKCKSCGKDLTMYNDDKICFNCVINPLDVLKALKDVKDLANGKTKKPKQ